MIRLTKDTDHVVTLTLDMADSPDNLLNHELVEAFQPVIEHLQGEKARGALRGVIVRSAKRTFLAGGELEYLQKNDPPSRVFELTQRLNKLLRSIESPGVPVVAALNGTALGIGFEFALACHHRVALNVPRASFGLPEINLGLMPGAGACIRLMWLMGIELAYPLLTSGHRYTPSQALAHGLVDELCESEDLMMEACKQFIMDTPHGARTWDRGGHIPGGTARKRDVAAFIVEQTAAYRRRTEDALPGVRGHPLDPRRGLEGRLRHGPPDRDPQVHRTAHRVHGRQHDQRLLVRAPQPQPRRQPARRASGSSASERSASSAPGRWAWGLGTPARARASRSSSRT